MPIPRVDIMSALNEARHWRDPRQFLDMVTNPWIPGNWYNPNTRSWNNPLQAFGLDRLFGGNRQGAPLPGFMRPGQTIDPYRYQGPGSPGWDPAIPGTQPSQQLPQGQGPLMSYQNPAQAPTRGVGVRGGEVIARGQAAQDMVGGMRDAQRDAAAKEQARQAMARMGNSER